MGETWQQLKDDLVRETERLFMECPDEIKRFRYGIITHSDAGKHAMNQYFGHWVHTYVHYYAFGDALDCVRRLARDDAFTLEHAKRMFMDVTNLKAASFAYTLAGYCGQKSLGRFVERSHAALDTLGTKEEFLDLLAALQGYSSRLYWWFHWYFPWGIGPAVFQRRSPEDIQEMVRLSGAG